MNKSFAGTGVALVTPFQNGVIDFDALTRIVQHVTEGGVDYLVVLGSTGESATLSRQEQRSVLDHVISVNNGTLPIIAGNFGGNNTASLTEYISKFDFNGIDAVLSSSPAYNKPGQEGIIHHYRAIADAAAVPVIMYNVPGRTSSNMKAETTLKLAEHRNIIGMKEASGDMVQGSQILKDRPDDFTVVSGDDPTALALTMLGGDGVISVIANLYPQLFSQMIRKARAGEHRNAIEIHESLLGLHQLLYAEGNPTGIKAAMSHRGLCNPEVRLPLVSATRELSEGLAAAIAPFNAL